MRQQVSVQGPQIPNQEPLVAQIALTADLQEKYLGKGLVGFGPYLEVLSNRAANDLVRQHGYRIFKQMLTDPEVDASVDALVQASNSQPIAFVNKLKKGELGYAKAEEIRLFVENVYERIPIDDWRREQIRQALTFGNAVSEIDWDVQSDGRFYIKRLRLQDPEFYGFLTDRWGEVYGVVPLNQASGSIFPLGNLIPLSTNGVKDIVGAVPKWKLSIWTWAQSGTDPRGTSILIPAYIPWWSKQRAVEEWSLWLSRYAQPSLWATPGPNAVPTCINNPDGSQTIIQPTQALLDALMQFKSASALALPFGSVVNLLTANGTVEPFLESIRLFNIEITRAILGQHLATSEGSHQANVSTQLHAMVLRHLIGSIHSFQTRMITKDLVQPLVQANYGDVDKELIPQVSLGDNDGFPPTVTEIAVLFQSGYFSSDQLPLLDKVLGLPIRTTNDRVGAGNLPPAPGTVNATTTKPSPQSASGGSEGSWSASARVGTSNK